MQDGWSYTRDTNDFINTIKNLKKTQPGNSILVKADFVGLCPNIPHESSLNAIKEALENLFFLLYLFKIIFVQVFSQRNLVKEKK